MNLKKELQELAETGIQGRAERLYKDVVAFCKDSAESMNRHGCEFYVTNDGPRVARLVAQRLTNEDNLLAFERLSDNNHLYIQVVWGEEL